MRLESLINHVLKAGDKGHEKKRVVEISNSLFAKERSEREPVYANSCDDTEGKAYVKTKLYTS